MKVYSFILTAVILYLSSYCAASPATQNVVLVTLDGIRWEEVFRGVDKRFIDNKKYLGLHSSHDSFKHHFVKSNSQENREAIMPFMWQTIARHGQIYGNRDQGSRAYVTNAQRVSYPGYSEILTGIADPEIKSNDRIPNPNRTVLEWVNSQAGFKNKVAAFGSWNVFPYIINEKRSNIIVNAGFEPFTELSDIPSIANLNQLQSEIPSPWGSVRFDAFTFRFGKTYLQTKRPRLLYLALGEGDDFAHDGQYDQYVNSMHRADKFISELWQWIQSDPHYKNKTTLLITTDHGRGNEPIDQWRGHGTGNPGSEAIWMAVVGPDTPATGVMKNVDDVTQSQVAGTVAKFLGLNYEKNKLKLKAGKPIESMFW
jgi:Sulfatase